MHHFRLTYCAMSELIWGVESGSTIEEIEEISSEGKETDFGQLRLSHFLRLEQYRFSHLALVIVFLQERWENWWCRLYVLMWSK